jgi:hypothetical protein
VRRVRAMSFGPFLPVPTSGIDIAPAIRCPALSRNGAGLFQGFGLGGFAERALIHENQLAGVPNEIPFPQAALLGCGVVTGAGSVLNTANVSAGDSVIIFGAGGVGLNAVSGARIAGASRIVVIDIQEKRLDAARRFGATDVIDSTKMKPVEAVRSLLRGGADHVFSRRETMKAMRARDTIKTHYIDGAFVESHGQEVMDIIRPTDGKVIARVTLGDQEDTRRAIGAAKSAFTTFGRTTKEERASILRRLVDKPCAAGTRLLVPKSRLEAVKRAIVDGMPSFAVDAPSDPKTGVGPMVSQSNTNGYSPISARASKKARRFSSAGRVIPRVSKRVTS